MQGVDSCVQMCERFKTAFITIYYIAINMVRVQRDRFYRKRELCYRSWLWHDFELLYTQNMWLTKDTCSINDLRRGGGDDCCIFPLWNASLSCCFTSTEVRWPIKDGDRVGRGWRWRLDCGNHPKKTRETMDHRQNNGSVKAVSPRHCPTTCSLHNCCFNCCAGQSH